MTDKASSVRGLRGILQPASDIGEQGRARRQLLPAALIVAVTLLVYIPAIQGGFFWDDHSFLIGSELIHAPDGLRRFWLTTQAQDYFPLTSTLLWLEWRLWGASAAGYHMVNVLLHAAAALLVWRVLRKLNVPGAWLAGMIFAVHPVAVASAAWITEGKNTLSLLLCLGSLLAWLSAEDGTQNAERRTQNAEREAGRASPEMGAPPRATGPNDSALRAPPTLRNPQFGACTPHSAIRIPHYVLSLALFLLALLAKTSVVMLPAVLLLCAWWRRGRISAKDLLRSVPFFALSLVLGLVTVWFQNHNVIGATAVRPEGFASRLAAAGWMPWFYLFKLLLPARLCVIYPRWEADGTSLLAFAPLALLVAGLALLWLRRKSWGRAPLFAAACFLAMLLPMLGFVDMAFMRFSLVADHFQYAAMIAVIALVAALSARAASAAGWRGFWAGRLAPAACVAALAVLACQRAALYGDEAALWRDTLAKNSSLPAARLAWRHMGDTYVRAQNYGEALDSFNHAVALDPDSAEAYYDRAAVYYELGRFDSAIGDYTEAIRLNPRSAAAYNNRGQVFAAEHHFQEAIRDYDAAMALDPRSAVPYNNRAAAYFNLQEYDRARADVQTCERLGGRPNAALVKALSAH